MLGQDLRFLIPSAMDHVYLNTAMIGPTPTSAMTAATAAELEWQEVGPGHFPFYQGARLEALRFQARLQALFTGGMVCLAYTHRDALMTVLYGLDLKAGDHVVTTDQEDTTMLGALLEIAHRFRLRVSVLAAGAPDFLEQLEGALTDRTRLVAMSHVSPETGWALPVSEVARRTRKWPAIRLLVDGAQAWGNIALDVEDTGADFYVLCGHKWLMAPPPAAALWIRQGRVGELVTIAPDEDRDARLQRLVAQNWTVDGDRFSSAATQPWPRLVGWALCLDYFEEDGFTAHIDYQFELANRLRDALQEVPSVDITEPLDPRMKTSLVVMRSSTLDTEAFAERLWAQNIFVHPLSGNRGVRASWASFNTMDDVLRLIAAVKTI